MALRDQPYLPLYVQDFSTDEKLMECSASATGLYIRIMCLLHKTNDYGKLLLKQKDKQNSDQIKNFALKIAKHVPYTFDVVFDGLNELLIEDVLKIEGDWLIQKRMVYDGELSITRSKTGSKGGETTQKRIKSFAKANNKANTEIENETIYNNIINQNSDFLALPEELKKYMVMIVLKMMEVWLQAKPTYEILKEIDYTSCLQIAYCIADEKQWQHASVVYEKENECLQSWIKIVRWLTDEKQAEYYKTMPLDKLATKKAFRDIKERMKTAPVLVALRNEELEAKRITHEQYFK